MNNMQFPWLALGAGLIIAMTLLLTDGFQPDSQGGLPLLMRLLMSEFAFLLNAAGLFLSVRGMIKDGFTLSRIAVATGCLIMAGLFFYGGILLWPQSGSPV